MFKYAKTNLLKLLQRKYFNTLFQSVTLCSTFAVSKLHSSAIKSGLISLRSQFKILDNSLIKVPLCTS